MPIYKVMRKEARLSRMVARFAGLQDKVTDFIIGALTRSKFETVACEMERQDYDVAQAIEAAIPQSVYNSFGFSVLPASKATGIVTLTAAVAPITGIPIAAGTQITDSSGTISYRTTMLVTLAAGTTTINAPIIADNAGTSSNVTAGTLTVLKSVIGGITSVTNPLDITSGTAAETNDQMRIRFINYIFSLSKATDGALNYAAKQAYLADSLGNITEQVRFSQTIGAPTASTGLPMVYVFNGVGGTSDALVARAQKIIDGYYDANGNPVYGYKAAGDIVTVNKVTERNQNVTCTITVQSGYDTAAIRTLADSALVAYITNMQIGATVLVSELYNAIMQIAGVYDASFSTPSSNVTQSSSTVALPGTRTITMASL